MVSELFIASELIFDIGIIIIIATLLSYIARLLKQPLLIAYVLAGVLIIWLGNFFSVFQMSINEIKTLAELGVAFLLFTVGLEIDFNKLKHVGFATIVGGVFQIIITFFVGVLLSSFLGFDPLLGIYIGLLVAFSSTMIVTRILVDKNEIQTLHGRIMIGILILQDIVVVLAMPLLMNIPGLLSVEVFGNIMIKGIGLFCLAIVLNRFIFPRILDYAAEMREILFLTAISVCFAFIGFSYILGFSIVIGAFIAGIALGNFPYNLEIVGETHALMDFFSIIFFTTLGMQFAQGLGVVTTMFYQFIILLFTIIILKPLILGFIYLVLGYGGRISTFIGTGLGQASEFSFIIAYQGLALNHLTTGSFTSSEIYSFIISIVVVSMVLTPYFVHFRNRIYKGISHLFSLNILKKVSIPHKVHRLGLHPRKGMRNHVVVFGADVMGGRIVEYLKKKRINFVVAEHNPETVKNLSSADIYSVYGDADNEELLKRVGLYSAKLAIITIPDVNIASFIIRKAKRFNKKIKIFARAYHQGEAMQLHECGADFVVVPELVSGEKLIQAVGHVIK